jgi:hypothetical protein
MIPIMTNDRPTLSLSEIDAFDPHGPSGRKWCPLCGEGKPRDAAHRCLSVDRTQGLWKCFRCGHSGQAREFRPLKATSASREERRTRLQNTFSLNSPLESPTSSFPTPKPDAPSTPDTLPSPPSVWQERWNHTGPLQGTPGEEYLRRRGISLEVALLADVRFSDSWPGGAAIVFPLRDRAGESLAVQGRAIRGDAKITYGPRKNAVFEAPITSGRAFVARLIGPCPPLFWSKRQSMR